MNAASLANVMAQVDAAGSATIVAALLCAAVVAASARRLWRRQRLTVNQRPALSWTLAVLMLQAGSAVLMALLLFPPSRPGVAGSIDVLTDDSDLAARPSGSVAAHRIALPEAAQADGAERVPDLATALRRWPGTTHLRVIGSGLVARDRDAVAGRALDWLPAPLPRGFVALHPPGHVAAGRRFSVGGRVHAVPGGSVSLMDPAGSVVARFTLPSSGSGKQDADGTFALSASARTPGAALWRVELRDAARRVVESLVVPVQVDAGQPARVLMLAGAPNAELKYLRRWAVDAGLRLDTRIDLGAGLQIGSAPSLDAASLASADLVVLDQRAWQGLAASQRTALDAAIDDGLGLLIRLSDPVGASDRARLKRMGIDAAPTAAASDVQLPADLISTLPPADGGVAEKPAPRTPLPGLGRAPLRLVADDGVVALRDAAGMPLAVWRSKGRGRVGVSSLDDTYRLVLAGQPRVHGQLWASLTATLARPAARTAIRIDDDPRVGQRMAICGIGDDAVVDTPQATATARAVAATPLRVDPATGIRRCAAFWAASAGWQLVRNDATDSSSDLTLFYVRAASEAPGLAGAANAEGTTALFGSKSEIHPMPLGQPGPRWPWLLAWLASVALLWWLERLRRETRP